MEMSTHQLPKVWTFLLAFMLKWENYSIQVMLLSVWIPSPIPSHREKHFVWQKHPTVIFHFQNTILFLHFQCHSYVRKHSFQSPLYGQTDPCQSPLYWQRPLSESPVWSDRPLYSQTNPCQSPLYGQTGPCIVRQTPVRVPCMVRQTPVRVVWVACVDPL